MVISMIDYNYSSLEMITIIIPRMTEISGILK